MVLTDTRVQFADKASLERMNRSYLLTQISGMDTEKGVATGHLFVHVSGVIDEYLVNAEHAAEFVAGGQSRILAVHTRAASATAAPSAADELAKFAALHQQGILTDDEWAAKKAQLLGL